MKSIAQEFVSLREVSLKKSYGHGVWKGLGQENRIFLIGSQPLNRNGKIMTL